MSARISSALRTLAPARSAFAPKAFTQFAPSTIRSFQTSRTALADGVLTTRRPVGAFRGSLFGFLLGTVLAGSGLYYYVVDEYKVSNTLLIEDVYALQAAVQRLEGYVKAIEDEVRTSRK